MKMDYRHDMDLVTRKDEEHRVGKSAEQRASDFMVNDGKL
jgi:hypothetical protein